MSIPHKHSSQVIKPSGPSTLSAQIGATMRLVKETWLSVHCRRRSSNTTWALKGRHEVAIDGVHGITPVNVYDEM